MHSFDALLTTADIALRTLFATPRAAHPCPTLPEQLSELSVAEKAHAGGLMPLVCCWRRNDSGAIKCFLNRSGFHAGYLV